MNTKFYLENLKGRDLLGDLGIDGKVIVRHLRKTGCKGVDWIHLAQDRVQWQALVSTVMNLYFP
jgi:hypothetical protein